MKKSIVFMFSGQGSQYYNMGREIFYQEPIFKKWMLVLDDIFKKRTGKSVLYILYDQIQQKSEKFDNLFYTHPAIFMVEYSLAKLLMEKGIYPDYVLGTSLGEFTAAAIAEVLSYEDVLHCLISQTQIVEENCEKGGMTAIITDFNKYYNVPLLSENSELVSVNFDTHFVLSSSIDKLNKIEKYLKEEGIVFQRLPVQYAFHSPLIDPIKPMLKDFFKPLAYKKPKIKYISSVTGDQITDFSNDYFWDVVRKPIDFRSAFSNLYRQNENIYIDLGPSGTLENFSKNILNNDINSSIFSVMNQYGNEIKNLNKIYNEKLTIQKNERKREGMKAYIFPGQGSQHKGMGGELFDEFSDLTKIADDILGYSIKDLCLNDPHSLLGLTDYTQSALFIVNAFSYLKKIIEPGMKPDYLAGHSLGEFNALFAAGAFDFATGVRLVKKRGELMRQATGGGMAAVIGLKEDDVNRILKENSLIHIDVANYNSPSQIVISGSQSMIEKAKPIFEANGAQNYIILKVSGAFHSCYMVNAAESFKKYIEQFQFFDLKTPVVSNVNARPYRNKDIKKNMIEQITKPVRWTETIRYLMGKGEMEFIQVGPGNVLTGLVKSIQRESEPLIINDKEKDLENGEGLIYKENILGSEDIASSLKEVENIDSKGEKTGEEKGKQSSNVGTLILGNPEFKKEFNVKHAYLAGGMYNGISSTKMVIRLAKAGMMSFFGAGGLELTKIEEAIKYIQKELNGQPYGINLVSNPNDLEKEGEIIDLLLKYGIRNIEASGFLTISIALVKYRLKGLKRNSEGKVIAQNRIIAKITRPEIAEVFLSPAPMRIVEKLVNQSIITSEEAELSKYIPMADALTAESDSGGNSEGSVVFALVPTIIRLRDQMTKKYNWDREIWVGAAGGIGTPEAVVASFSMGVDYIVTGSINQCTVEACTSDIVKDLLQQMNVQDTEYAPASDMFEIGSKVQVLKKGLFFPARANKLYELYKQYNSLDEIDDKTKTQLQESYFKSSFDEVYSLAKRAYPEHILERAEKYPKSKMAIVFKWYLTNGIQLASNGDPDNKINYQIYCGPALGAFNQWVKGTNLENWRNRHVDEIGEKIIEEAAILAKHRFKP